MVLNPIKSFLEKIDELRDRLLFPLLKRYWPSEVSPNHLSGLKIFAGMGIAFFLFFEIAKFWIFSTYIFGLILDLLDGSVARAKDLKTKLGAYLDPLGDKFLNISMAASFLWQDYKILFLAIALPELVSVSIASWSMFYKQPIESNIFGKTKMFLQSGVFLGIFIFPNYKNLLFIILWLTVILALVSLIIYKRERMKEIVNQESNLSQT